MPPKNPPAQNVKKHLKRKLRQKGDPDDKNGPLGKNDHKHAL